MALNRRFWLAGGLLIVICASLLSGSSGALSANYQKPVSDGGSITPYDVPLESYMIDTALYGAAINFYMVDCLAGSNFEYPRAKVDVNLPRSGTWTELGYFVVSQERAKVFGYRAERDPRVVIDRGPKRARVGFDEAYESCVERSIEEIPDFAESANFIFQLSLRARDASYKDSRVMRSVAAWERCMLRAGVTEGLRGDPIGPEAFRSHVLTEMDNLHHQDVGETALLPATAGEIELAVTDARCQDSSGYTDALYNSMAREQSVLIAENQEAMNEVAKVRDRLNSIVDTYLGIG